MRAIKPDIAYSGFVHAGPHTDFRNAAAVIALFDQAANAMRQSPARDRSIVRLPAHGRLLVTGDLHDNPVHLQKVITLADLAESKDHHVILHEMIHGERLVNSLDLSHRVLARVAELTARLPDQVHPLLANHELAQMTGKGVSKGGGNSVELFNDGLEYVFGDDAGDVAAAIGEFIKAMPMAAMSDSGVMCSHSLPAPRMMEQFDQTVIARDLRSEDYQAPFGAAHLMVWGRSHTHSQIDLLSEAWHINLFCIGHEHVDTGIELKWPRLMILNSDHERGTVLPVNLAEIGDPTELLLHAIPLAAV